MDTLMNITMKKSITILFCLVLSIVAYGQEKDVTRFLNIPIEGEKSEMFEKIKAKGFKVTKFAGDKILTGKFNGQDVYVDVAADKNDEVYRVIVADKTSCNERSVRIKFNNLCYQFSENSKYLSATKNWAISEDDDISYELRVGKKTYQAVFFQKPSEIGDSIIWSRVTYRYALNKLHGVYGEQSEEEELQEIERIYNDELSELCLKKRVWFTIMEKEPTDTLL